MGAAKSKNQLYEDSVKVFSEQERKQIEDIHKKICKCKNESFSRQDLEDYLQMQVDPGVADHLFLYMSHVFDHQEAAAAAAPAAASTTSNVNHEQFLVTLAHLLKGSMLETAQVLCCLSTGTTAESANVQQLMELIVTLLYSYSMIMMRSDSAFSSWKLFATEESTLRLAKTLVYSLVYKDGAERGRAAKDLPLEQPYCLDDIEMWVSKSSLLLCLMHGVFQLCFPVSFVEGASSVSLCPRCEGINWNKVTTVLDLPSVIFLNSAVSPELRDQWRLLYSSRVHGESFHTMTKHIMEKGPSLLVIKDTDGHVFGGFACESWTLNAQFAGSSKSFLFGIHPHLEVYPASGLNENYMYLNQGQETLPNGLGMGGQFGYHGLWLDYEYGHGHSKAEPTCTTFQSPQLSSKPDFAVDVVEVWGVGPEPIPSLQDEAEGKVGSILDKDMSAKAMLTLLDKGPVSEGLREGDPMAESPGAEALPPLS